MSGEELTVYLVREFWDRPIQQQIKILCQKYKQMGIQLEKHCGKRRNCLLRAISPFPTMFSKVICCQCVKMSIYGVKD